MGLVGEGGVGLASRQKVCYCFTSFKECLRGLRTGKITKFSIKYRNKEKEERRLYLAEQQNYQYMAL